jgi:methylase of polypeptide subunit release factors
LTTVFQRFFEKKIIMTSTIEASEQKWSATAQLYIRYFEPCTVTIGKAILSAINLNHPENSLRVIECGCGAGALSLEISRMLAADEANDHQLTVRLT